MADVVPGLVGFAVAAVLVFLFLTNCHVSLSCGRAVKEGFYGNLMLNGCHVPQYPLGKMCDNTWGPGARCRKFNYDQTCGDQCANAWPNCMEKCYWCKSVQSWGAYRDRTSCASRACPGGPPCPGFMPPAQFSAYPGSF